ncbi:site-specific integrase [Aliifodinibius sp. S!AR15-10]|uniref:site-specific integrase n=1 Tax=Aliifodinibius sp. S!AR15-10 TaxID=2950437 RepID=UPI002856F8E5|nr:site-specific integrase [Aliifodinibius sp. S!AR15-10]MDR8394449.1 site-specific integrase [Aliifodinibius sp. S!AR15-10]
MATLSYYLKKRKNKDKHPLYLRIIHNRKSRLINTDIRLATSNWNDSSEEVRKSHPIHKKLNNFLKREKLNAEAILLDIKSRGNGVSINDIKKAITENKVEGDEPDNSEEQHKPDFFEYAEDVIKDFKVTLSHTRWKSYNTVYNKFQEFWKQDTLPFEEFDVEVLRKYEVYCMEERSNKPNTIKSDLKMVRKIFNSAIQEGVIPRDMYPFRFYTMPSNPVVKTKLTEEEINTLRNVETQKGTRLRDTKNIFLFAYYCWGVRTRDACLLKWGNIKGDRLVYIMSKTGVRMSIKLPRQAADIIAQYKPDGKVNNDHFLFPFLDHRKDYSDKEFLDNQISSKNALINKYLTKLQKLAEIDQGISFHVARHSFAQRCLEKGLRTIEIRDLLGHKSITSTMKYLRSLENQHLDKSVEGLFD